MSYCSRECSNQGKFYALMQKLISISKTDEDNIKKLSDVDNTIKIKGITENISQCPLVIRKSLDGKEVVVEGCAPAKPNANDIQTIVGGTWSKIQVFKDAAAAKDYISANILKWETDII